MAIRVQLVLHLLGGFACLGSRFRQWLADQPQPLVLLQQQTAVHLAELPDAASATASYEHFTQWLPNLGEKMCAGAFSYDKSSSNTQACQALCSEEPNCLYYSLWSTAGGRWCRLLFDCAKVPAASQKLELTIYQPETRLHPIGFSTNISTLQLDSISGSQGANDAHRYEVFQGPGSYHCGGTAKFSGSVPSPESCEAKCSMYDACNFYTTWVVAGGTWCKLSSSCEPSEFPSTATKFTVYKKVRSQESTLAETFTESKAHAYERRADSNDQYCGGANLLVGNVPQDACRALCDVDEACHFYSAWSDGGCRLSATCDELAKEEHAPKQVAVYAKLAWPPLALGLVSWPERKAPGMETHADQLGGTALSEEAHPENVSVDGMWHTFSASWRTAPGHQCGGGTRCGENNLKIGPGGKRFQMAPRGDVAACMGTCEAHADCGGFTWASAGDAWNSGEQGLGADVCFFYKSTACSLNANDQRDCWSRQVSTSGAADAWNGTADEPESDPAPGAQAATRVVNSAEAAGLLDALNGTSDWPSSDPEPDAGSTQGLDASDGAAAHDFCAGEFQFTGNANGLEMCNDRCTQDASCAFYSMWHIAGSTWCRLLYNCDEDEAADKYNLRFSIFPKPVAADPNALAVPQAEEKPRKVSMERASRVATRSRPGHGVQESINQQLKKDLEGTAHALNTALRRGREDASTVVYRTRKFRTTSYCSGHPLFNGTAASEETCRAKCDAQAGCKYYSVWPRGEGAPVLCRLTESCFHKKEWRGAGTVQIYKKMLHANRRRAAKRSGSRRQAVGKNTPSERELLGAAFVEAGSAFDAASWEIAAGVQCGSGGACSTTPLNIAAGGLGYQNAMRDDVSGCTSTCMAHAQCSGFEWVKGEDFWKNGAHGVDVCVFYGNTTCNAAPAANRDCWSKKTTVW